MNQTRIKHLIPIFAGLMASLLIYAMDSTIFSTAMKKIVEDIGGKDYYAWPFTSYLLFSTIAIPISGAISDLQGHKPVFLCGIALFLSGSALCGISGNMTELILFRALQGTGGGIIVAGVFTIIADLFPPAERGKYTGIVSSMYGLANLIGPVTGGFLSDRFGWRWIFYINLPIGVFAFLALFFTLPGNRPDSKQKTDLSGMIVLALILFPVLTSLSLAGAVLPWNSPWIVGMAVFAALMLLIFILLQRRAKNPVLPSAYFTDRRINMALALSFFNQMSLIGAVVYLPYFEQNILKMSATDSGLVLAPMMVSLVLAANIVGRLISRTNQYRIWSLIGFCLIGFSMWRFSVMDKSTGYSVLILNAVIMGWGVGMNMPVGNVNAQNSVSKCRIGSVTSAVTLFRNIGTATGSAFFGTVLTARNVIGWEISGVNRVFQVGIAVALLGILSSSFLRDAKLPES
ncbi:MDR family MFS transporter [Caproicibacter sp.]|uniref:MDR family MFS transporter n=1 Tax=Caproicibacter sp. TaxID=2814884 RepID=UPI0039893C2B